MREKIGNLVLALATPKVIQPEVRVGAVTVVRVVDLPGAKIVRAFVRELPAPLVLWTGDQYDAIGDWTQKQANERILELLA